MQFDSFSIRQLQFRHKLIKGISVWQVYDIIRKEWIKAQPEEIVRQRLVQRMIYELGYPQALLVVEREFYLMPHLILTDRQTLPQRRIDILCFAQNIHPQYELYPLLMVECKAKALNEKVFRQVIGYNVHMKAPFIAIANDLKVQVGWYDTQKKDYQMLDFLPSYQELMRSIQM